MTEPLCAEPEFTALVNDMVASAAPKLFAIVQERRPHADAWIAGWGIAFEDCVEVVSAESGVRMTLQAPENAVRLFNRGDAVRARLIWVDFTINHVADCAG